MIILLVMFVSILTSCSRSISLSAELNRPLSKNISNTKILALKTMPYENLKYIEESSNDIAKVNDSKVKQKQYKEKYSKFILDYKGYYTDARLIRKGTPTNKENDVFFYQEEQNIVKPEGNIEYVQYFKKNNQIPMTDEMYFYFEQTIDKSKQHAMDQKIVEKTYNYAIVDNLNNKQLNNFYNLY